MTRLRNFILLWCLAYAIVLIGGDADYWKDELGAGESDRVTPHGVVAPAPIFSDGFESGSTSAWSTDSATVAAAHVTDYGREGTRGRVDVHSFTGTRYRVILEAEGGATSVGDWSTTAPTPWRLPIPGAGSPWRVVVDVIQEGPIAQPWRFTTDNWHD